MATKQKKRKKVVKKSSVGDSKIRKKIKELLAKGTKQGKERAEYYKQFLKGYKASDPTLVRGAEKQMRKFAGRGKIPKDVLTRRAAANVRSSKQLDKDVGKGQVRALTTRKKKRQGLDPRVGRDLSRWMGWPKYPKKSPGGEV
tara:strand:- start:978 stop:1406 length:429 start_codon:yes stop_codon:yes gene_type:complete